FATFARSRASATRFSSSKPSSTPCSCLRRPLAGAGPCDSNGRMSSSRLPAFSLAFVLGTVLAAGNVLIGKRVAPGLLALPPLAAWLAGAPILVALVLAALLHRSAAAPAAAPAPPPRDDTPALRLLAALQADGRLVDFLQEDIEG